MIKLTMMELSLSFPSFSSDVIPAFAGMTNVVVLVWKFQISVALKR